MPDGEVGPEAVRPVGDETWHLAHASDPVTLCGDAIPYGSRRKLWAETPRDERCLLCLRHLKALTERSI